MKKSEQTLYTLAYERKETELTNWICPLYVEWEHDESKNSFM